MNTFKRLTAAALSLLLTLTVFLNTNVLAAESMLYEAKNLTTITSGVTYEEVTRFYDRGWLNLYALRIDLNNPNVKMNVLSSLSETGLKETVLDLARSNGAVAAINGDFFGNTTLASSMGIVMEDGILAETRNYYNASKPTYAGLYIDNENTPFIDYLKINHIGLLTNGVSHIEIDQKNKVTDMKKPIYVDKTAMTTTEKLDNRFKNLYKIIIEDGLIKDISAAGTIVTVPDNGFLIVMDGPTAVNILKNFNVGDTATYYENTQFLGHPSTAKSDIKFGISGGSKILESGETRDNGLIIEPHKRHPRTVIGINKDKTELVLIVIDGRSNNSLGATHYEAAEILRDYAAWDAFHLDGGGSTTVVVRNEGDTELTVGNNPSDGGLRRIPNAVGVLSANGTGALSGIHVSSGGKKEGITAMATIPLNLTVSGHDENLNPVPIGAVTYSVEGVEGYFNGNSFTPSTEGEAVITAASGEAIGTLTFNVVSKPESVRITPHTITAKVGEAITYKAEIVNKDGYGIDVTNSITGWTSSNAIGNFSGSTFTVTKNGVTTISAGYYGFSGVASVAAGTYTKPLTNFETDTGISFSPKTSGVTGGIAYTRAVSKNGRDSLQINYQFNANVEAEQIAAVDFQNTGRTTEGVPVGFGFWLTGDSSGSRVNAIFTDKLGNEKSYGFNVKMDDGNWKYYYQTFPASGMELPLKLSRITITSDKNLKSDVLAKVYLDNIQVAYSNRPDTAITKGPAVSDYKHQDLSTAPDGVNITVLGPTAFVKTSLEKEMLNKAVSAIEQSSDFSLFAGYTGTVNGLTVPGMRWKDTYESSRGNNFKVINLATSKGGLRVTNASQWKSLLNDLNADELDTIIVLNKDIWDKNDGFGDTKERDLFHLMLKEYREKTESDVFVVAGTGSDTKSYIIDGIRYFTLNGLVSDGADTSGYNLLTIKATGSGFVYDIKELASY